MSATPQPSAAAPSTAASARRRRWPRVARSAHRSDRPRAPVFAGPSPDGGPPAARSAGEVRGPPAPGSARADCAEVRSAAVPPVDDGAGRSTTRSHAASTAGRWLTTSRVRPSAIRGRALMIAASVSASTPSVGSSSSSSGRSASTARASATRRCCPVDRPAPSSPTGVSSGTSSAAAATAARSSASVASGRASRTLSATEPATSTGRCGTHATRRSQAALSMSARSTPPTVIRPASGVRSPSIRSSSVDLPAPLRPRRPTRARGGSVRSSPSSTRPPRPSTTRPAQRTGTREGSGAGARAARAPRGQLEHREDLGSGGEALGGVVEAGPHRAQRQVDLGREHEHQQAGRQVEPAFDQPQADRDGHERDRQCRRQLERERGQEGHPQGAHGGPAVLRGERAEPSGLVAGAPERDEHLHARDEVEEVVAQHGERAPLAAGRPFGVQADEDPEDRDERHGQADDDARRARRPAGSAARRPRVRRPRPAGWAGSG